MILALRALMLEGTNMVVSASVSVWVESSVVDGGWRLIGGS